MFSNPKIRGLVWQVLLLAAVAGTGWFLFTTTQHNLQTRGIAVGMEFLSKEAGFEIAETLVDYAPSDSYARALWVGMLNTLLVGLIGIVLATVVGTCIGIARLSGNWLVARLASGYVEITRNIPLLLQLFVWYGLFTEMMPAVRQAYRFFGGAVVLSQRGLRMAWPEPALGWTFAGWLLLAGVIGAWFWRRHARRVQDATGRQLPMALPLLGLILGLPLLGWLLGGAPTAMQWPTLRGFNYMGGVQLPPEFTALVLGLSLYTAGFIAEVVRGGMQSVDHGQSEAGMALGLSATQRLRLITLPLALRVIVPPMTSQYLNLVKNSSLAVAIGYPDLTSVANTTMNQTGQAIEAVAIMMAVYLTISLATSFFMNWYNGRMKLVTR